MDIAQIRFFFYLSNLYIFHAWNWTGMERALQVCVVVDGELPFKQFIFPHAAIL